MSNQLTNAKRNCFIVCHNYTRIACQLNVYTDYKNGLLRQHTQRKHNFPTITASLHQRIIIKNRRNKAPVRQWVFFPLMRELFVVLFVEWKSGKWSRQDYVHTAFYSITQYSIRLLDEMSHCLQYWHRGRWALVVLIGIASMPRVFIKGFPFDWFRIIGLILALVMAVARGLKHRCSVYTKWKTVAFFSIVSYHIQYTPLEATSEWQIKYLDHFVTYSKNTYRYLSICQTTISTSVLLWCRYIHASVKPFSTNCMEEIIAFQKLSKCALHQ